MRWLSLLLPLLFWPQAARPVDDAERARLAAERQALIDGFAQEELACQQRFFVNDCVEDVRRRRREALAPLRARELELDDVERQQRAAERRAAIEAKQREQAARPAPASAPELPPRSPAEPASAGPASHALERGLGFLAAALRCPCTLGGLCRTRLRLGAGRLRGRSRRSRPGRSGLGR